MFSGMQVFEPHLAATGSPLRCISCVRPGGTAYANIYVAY